MKVLLYTTRNINGVGENVLEHFAHIKEISTEIHLLTDLKNEKKVKMKFREYGVEIDCLRNEKLYYYLNDILIKKDNRTWLDIYDSIDVSNFSDFDLLYICGGIYFPNVGISFDGAKKNKFPLKCSKRFISNGVKIINILTILKIHNTYKIPLHEVAFDPDELNCYLFHDSIKSKIGDNYYLYHGYDDSRYNITRLDSVQYYYNDKQFLDKQFLDKEYDLTFGYTYSNIIREKYLKEWEHFYNNLLKNEHKVNVFKKILNSKDKSENNFLTRSEYLKYIEKSKYTYILPSYWDEFFSGYRLFESLFRDCLPILNENCNTKYINKSFNVNLDILKLEQLPSDEFRNNVLIELKEKILKCEPEFLLKNVKYPETLFNKKNRLDFLFDFS